MQNCVYGSYLLCKKQKTKNKGGKEYELIYRINAIPVKVSRDFLIKNCQANSISTDKLKFKWKFKEPKITKMRKKNKIGGRMLLDLKNYSKAIIIKAAWYQPEDS